VPETDIASLRKGKSKGRGATRTKSNPTHPLECPDHGDKSLPSRSSSISSGLKAYWERRRLEAWDRYDID
jgi:hypothetical protein